MAPLDERLILFTRWPEAGTTKTRLIPVLGAEAAADVQRALAAHTFATLRRACQRRGCKAQVAFAGGTPERMAAWVGADLPCRPQAGGDLGQRMAAAFDQAFAEGADRVVVIGSDCPGLSVWSIDQAFRALAHADLVLGPALDGGYTLIGLRRPAPRLFADIAWGTSTVLAETERAARASGLSLARLPPLQDIDTPEDLPVWERIRQEEPAPAATRISIILPARNESDRIQASVKSALAGPHIEAVVVDGGSTDDTAARANQAGAAVLTTNPGRAEQMNRGADLATGDLLVFLHGDTCLPTGYEHEVRTLLSRPEVAFGAFRLGIDAAGSSLRVIERLANLRTRWLGLPYGDQALVLKRETFEAAGGFAAWPLLEDLDLVRRLRAFGGFALCRGAVRTSAARWQRCGVLRTTVVNQLILLGYALGLPPARLARWYAASANKTPARHADRPDPIASESRA